MADRIQRVIYRIIVDTSEMAAGLTVAKAQLAALHAEDRKNTDAALANADKVSKARATAAKHTPTPGPGTGPAGGGGPAHQPPSQPTKGGPSYHTQLNVIIGELQRIGTLLSANRFLNSAAGDAGRNLPAHGHGATTGTRTGAGAGDADLIRRDRQGHDEILREDRVEADRARKATRDQARELLRHRRVMEDEHLKQQRLVQDAEVKAAKDAAFKERVRHERVVEDQDRRLRRNTEDTALREQHAADDARTKAERRAEERTAADREKARTDKAAEKAQARADKAEEKIRARRDKDHAQALKMVADRDATALHDREHARRNRREPDRIEWVDPRELIRYAVHHGGENTQFSPAQRASNAALQRSINDNGFDPRFPPTLHTDRRTGRARLDDGTLRVDYAVAAGIDRIPVTIRDRDVPRGRREGHPYRGEFDSPDVIRDRRDRDRGYIPEPRTPGGTRAEQDIAASIRNLLHPVRERNVQVDDPNFGYRITSSGDPRTRANARLRRQEMARIGRLPTVGRPTPSDPNWADEFNFRLISRSSEAIERNRSVRRQAIVAVYGLNRATADSAGHLTQEAQALRSNRQELVAGLRERVQANIIEGRAQGLSVRDIEQRGTRTERVRQFARRLVGRTDVDDTAPVHERDIHRRDRGLGGRVRSAAENALGAAARREIADWARGLSNLSNTVSGGTTKAFRYWQIVLIAVFTVVVALIPLIVVLTGVLGSMLSAATAAAGAVAVFALAAVGNLKTLSKAMKETTESGAPLKKGFEQVGAALIRMQDVWNGFVAATQAPVFAVFTDAINLVSDLLPRFIPLVETTGRSIQAALGVLDQAFSGERFARFLGFLNEEGPAAALSLFTSLKDIAAGVGELALSFQPYIAWFLRGFESMARKFKEWAQSLDGSQAFENFMNYVMEQGPVVLKTIKDLGSFLITLGKALMPASTAIMVLIQALSAVVSVIPIGALRTITVLLLSWLALKAAIGIFIALRTVVGGVSLAVLWLGNTFWAATPAIEAATVGVVGFSRALNLLMVSTAVGLVLVGIVALVSTLSSTTDSAATATAGLTAEQQALADALKDSGGVIDDNVRKTAALSLEQAGLLKAGGAAGISADQMVTAYLGSPEDWQAVINTMKTRRGDVEKGLKPAKPSKEGWGWLPDWADPYAGDNPNFRTDDQQKQIDAMDEAIAKAEAQKGALDAANASNDRTALGAKGAAHGLDLETAAAARLRVQLDALIKTTPEQDRINAAIDARTAWQDAERDLAEATTKRQRLKVDVPLANTRAQEHTREAELALAEAQRRSREMQISLTQVRIHAADQLEDLKNKLRDIALDEEGSSIALARAEQNLRKVMADPLSTSLDRRQALLDQQKAKNDYTDTITGGARTRRDAPETERQIGESVNQAQRDATDAARNTTKAHADLAAAKRDQTRSFEDGQKALADADRDVTDLGTKVDKARTAYEQLMVQAGLTAGSLQSIADKQLALQKDMELTLKGVGLEDVEGRLKTILIYTDALKRLAANPGMTVKQAVDAATTAYEKRADQVPNRGTPGQKEWQIAASGGPVQGRGTGTSDEVPVWASNNEHIWTAAEVRAAGGHTAMKRMREAALAGKVAASGPTFNPAAMYAGLTVTPRLVVPSASGPGAARSTVTNTTGGFNVGDVTINNPVREPAGDSLYRTVRRLQFEHQN